MEDKERNFPDVLKRESTRRGFLKGSVIAAGSAVALATIGGLAAKEVHAQAKPPEPKKDLMKFLFAERQNCTGCRACEYACSVFHTGVVRPSVARVHVMKYKDVIDVPVICWHCSDRPCIEACPTTPKAIVADPNHNGIILNEKICLGAKCLKCKEVCPADYVWVNPDNGQPLLCDMCAGEPACVKACADQSGNPQGPCLMANKLGFGVNMAFRDVKPEQAGADLLDLMFYPNTVGKRVTPVKTVKTKKARR
ncbi:MAG: twin-arginine translocation signal domain-containing protein [Deltaproteobacteria bacterium]|nr:twin-arginine translocation signal domain-containing protein [Deltaproteobacteria bacterium]